MPDTAARNSRLDAERRFIAACDALAAAAEKGIAAWGTDNLADSVASVRSMIAAVNEYRAAAAELRRMEGE